jgi:hypothetical protein
MAQAAAYAFALQVRPLPIDRDDTYGAYAGASAAQRAHPSIYVRETVQGLPSRQVQLYTLLFFCIMSATMAMTAIWMAAIVSVITVMSITLPWASRL